MMDNNIVTDLHPSLYTCVYMYGRIMNSASFPFLETPEKRVLEANCGNALPLALIFFMFLFAGLLVVLIASLHRID